MLLESRGKALLSTGFAVVSPDRASDGVEAFKTMRKVARPGMGPKQLQSRHWFSFNEPVDRAKKENIWLPISAILKSIIITGAWEDAVRRFYRYKAKQGPYRYTSANSFVTLSIACTANGISIEITSTLVQVIHRSKKQTNTHHIGKASY